MDNAYFIEETQKARDRFNKTFGMQAHCDLKLRQAAIFGICLLGCTQKRIEKENLTLSVRLEAQRFKRIHTALNRVFDQIEAQHHKEGTSHENPKQAFC